MRITSWTYIVVLACTAAALTGCRLSKPGVASRTPQSLVGALSSKKLKQGKLTREESAQACIAVAERLVQHGHAQEAIAQYERARQQSPDQINYAHRLAVLYDQAGNSDAARREFERALSLQPNDASLINDFGYFQYSHGDYGRAEQTFRQAIQLAPRHERAYVNLGLVLGQQQRWNESYEAFRQAIGPAAAHSNVGVLMAKQGLTEQARVAFRNALEVQKDLKQPAAFLAYLEKN